MKKKILATLLLIALAGIIGYNYMYKSHRDIATEKADITIDTATILNDYKTDEAKANTTYLDKVIAVTGKITNFDVASNSIIVDEKLFCTAQDKLIDLKVNETITLKGRFLGYDDLLEEMKMDQITVNK